MRKMNSRGDRYTYDNEGQLTAASYQATTPDGTPGTPERTDSFIYDQLGNRKSPPNNQIASLGSVTFHRRDNGLNQYLNWTQSAINYESNGNLYQDGWLTASFNALNQNTGIWSWRVTPTGDWVNSAYDPLGRCVTRWSPLATTYLYYDGWSLIQEGPASGGWIWNGTALVTTAGSGGAARAYIHGARVDEIVCSAAFSISTDPIYHHYDGSGQGLMLTDIWANITEQYQYDAFGKPYFYSSTAQLLNSSPFGNRFLFTGREWLKEVAVYDFRNRVYLPELGRFIQPDPKQFAAGDYNLYRYCHNDPINRSDPFGLTPDLAPWNSETMGVGAEMPQAYLTATAVVATPLVIAAGMEMGGTAIAIRGALLVRAAAIGAIAPAANRLSVQFGRTANQISHAFAHTDKLGFSRTEVMSAVRNSLSQVASQIKANQTLNKVIEVGGQKIQYTAYKLQNGVINVGRIHEFKNHH